MYDVWSITILRRVLNRKLGEIKESSGEKAFESFKEKV
jgi:hypothetical protein